MIQLLNPQLDSHYLDIWGEYIPFALQSWAPIIEAGCFVPRWYDAPLNALQFMTAGDYNSWSLQIPAGSFIMEVMHSHQEAPPEAGVQIYSSGEFNVQITDTGLNYEWFSQPIPDSLFYKRHGRFQAQQTAGRNGHVLPKPYPVLTPGNFQIERWCTATGRCELLFAVAVPREVA
jgi:hypothetical protein